MRLRNWTFAAVPLLALAIAGCGGGGGDETTAAPRPTVEEQPALSKAELIKQGDSICAEVNAAVGSVNSSEAETTDQVSQAADLYSGMVERLKGLGTPAEDTGYSEFIDMANELAQAESDAQLASERGDEAGLAEAEGRAEEALENFQEAASAYGFEECSEEPSVPSPSGTAASGGTGEEEVAPEVEAAPEEVAPEVEAAPEEVAPEEVAPEGGGTGAGGGEEAGSGGGSGGIGPG
jgi:hypothetical protein